MPRGYNWTSKECQDWRAGWIEKFKGCDSLKAIVKRSREETALGLIVKEDKGKK